MNKFKKKISGNILTLKIVKPSLNFANIMFNEINHNRQRLEKYLHWVDSIVTIEKTLKYLFDSEKLHQEGKQIEYGIYLKNTFIGSIKIYNIDYTNKSSDVGYWISESFSNKGYMTITLEMIIKEAFETIGLNRIQLICDEENIGSSKVAQKNGFILEGKLRERKYNKYFKEFRNYLLYSLLKSDYINNLRIN